MADTARNYTKISLTGSDKSLILTNMNLHPTGIPALDTVLNGGFPPSATVLLNGDAGVGKTTLASQWLAEGVRQYDQTGVYITMTEPTTVLLGNLHKFSFYSKNLMATADIRAQDFEGEWASKRGIHFVDLRVVLDDLGLIKSTYTHKDVEKIHETLLKLLSMSEASRIVLDSVTAMSYLLNNESLFRNFIFKFSQYLALAKSNVMLIGESPDTQRNVGRLEEFISDGVMELKYIDSDIHNFRAMRIKKMRGTDFNNSPVPYKITEHGLRFYPSFEKTLDYSVPDTRVSTGVQGLDEITNGGFLEGSAILLSGPSGSGKSILALQSTHSVVSTGNKAVLISLEEPKSQIYRNSISFGWDFKKYEKEGLLKIVTAHPEKEHLSKLLTTLRETVEEFKPARIVIDSLSSLGSTYDQDLIHSWVSQLVPFLKKSKVTALFISATSNLLGSGSTTDIGLSSIFDNIIVLRYVEIESEFQHALFVLKMRGTRHSKVLHRLTFDTNGLTISQSFKGYENIFMGTARQVSNSAESHVRDLLLENLGPMGEQIFVQQQLSGITNSSLQILVKELANEGILDEEKSIMLKKQFAKIFGEVKKKDS